MENSIRKRGGKLKMNLPIQQENRQFGFGHGFGFPFHHGFGFPFHHGFGFPFHHGFGHGFGFRGYRY
jgi:hypothetical protein